MPPRLARVLFARLPQGELLTYQFVENKWTFVVKDATLEFKSPEGLKTACARMRADYLQIIAHEKEKEQTQPGAGSKKSASLAKGSRKR